MKKYNHIYTSENANTARKIFRLLRIRLGDKIHLVKDEIFADWSLEVSDEWIEGFCSGVEDRLEVESKLAVS